MKSRLPREKASANLCGLRARIGGERKRKEKAKQTMEPRIQARKPRNLQKSEGLIFSVSPSEVILSHPESDTSAGE